MTTSEAEALAKVWHEAMEKGADERGVMMGLPIVALEAVAQTVRAQDEARGGTLTAEEVERRKELIQRLWDVANAHCPNDDEATIDAGLASRDALLAHSAAQGRTIAALEEQLSRVCAAISEAHPGVKWAWSAAPWLISATERARGNAEERATSAESALATLRQEVGPVAKTLRAALEDEDVDGPEPLLFRAHWLTAERARALVTAYDATSSEHPDTDKARGAVEAFRSAALAALAEEMALWSTKSARTALRGMKVRLRSIPAMLGDSGPSGGGDVRDCGACGGPLPSHRDAVCEKCTPESAAHAIATSMEPTTPPDVAASEPKPTPEEDWRTVENAVASGYSKKSLAWAALSRLKAAPRRAADEALRDLAMRLGDHATGYDTMLSGEALEVKVFRFVHDEEERARKGAAEAMRERCAELADELERNDDVPSARSAARMIAQAIRTLPL